MDFLCVTQSHTIDRTAVARNGSMDKFWKRWSGLKCVLLAWKPLLKVTFCVIIAWAIPSDVKKVFVIVGLVLVTNMTVVKTWTSNLHILDYRRLPRLPWLFGFRRKSYVYLIWKRPVSKFLYDIRGNSSVLVMFFLIWRASHVGHVKRLLSSNTLI